jgi:hypothetical protein
MLYELLCSRRPFHAESKEGLLTQILTAEVPPPRSLRPDLDRNLEAVVLRCLTRDPRQRFASAGELADELQRWLETGKPRTRPASWPARAWRPVRKHPIRAATLALAALATVTLLLLGHLLSPDRPLRAMQQERAADRAVRPIEEGGGLRWFRWRAGLPVRIHRLPKAGALRFVGPAFTLLEIYTDDGSDAAGKPYEFRAWVRHDEGEDGEVGLFFGLREHPGPRGPVLSFCTCSFNDLRPQDRRLGRPDNPIVVNLNLYRPEDPDRAITAFGPQTVRLGKPQRFLPAGVPRQQGPWRQILVRVAADGIRTTWKGEVTRTAELNREAFAARVGGPLAACKEANVTPPEFPLRGGVGLFVSDAEVSFKGVEIGPLPRN